MKLKILGILFDKFESIRYYFYVVGLQHLGNKQYESVQIGWDKYTVLTSDEFDHYKIKIKKFGDSVNAPNVYVSSVEEIEIPELQPDTQYEISVLVVSKSFKSSMYSDNLITKTKKPEKIWKLEVIGKINS